MNFADQPSSDLDAQPVYPPGRPVLTGRLPRISGSAMPAGVHLSTGVVRTGSDLALVLSGLAIAAMASAALVMTYVVTWAADQVLAVPLVPALLQVVPPDSGVRGTVIAVGLNVLTLLCFLVVMRLSPLSGYHAAEHKVIGAIEHFGEPTVDRARAMPRAHQRCGSNLLAGVLPLLLVGIPLFQYYPALAAILTIFGWTFRFQTGYLIQMIFATKEPTDKQLRAGLESARKLLYLWRQDPYKRVPPLVNLWQRGFLQTFAGLIAGMYALEMLYNHLHIFLDF